MPDIMLEDIQRGIAWTEAFATGIAAVDEDHQSLIRLINTFVEVVKNDEGIIAMDDIFRGLVRYTEFHFAMEERMMAEAGFPGLEAHAAAHRGLTSRVGELRDLYMEKPGPEAEGEILSFLGNWLSAHILGMDMLYTASVSEMLRSRPGRDI